MRKLRWSARGSRDYDRLDRQVRDRVLAALDRLVETGHGDIRRLRNTDPPAYRLRVGPWRVLYSIIENRTVLVLRVLPRGRAYRHGR